MIASSYHPCAGELVNSSAMSTFHIHAKRHKCRQANVVVPDTIHPTPALIQNRASTFCSHGEGPPGYAKHSKEICHQGLALACISLDLLSSSWISPIVLPLTLPEDAERPGRRKSLGLWVDSLLEELPAPAIRPLRCAVSGNSGAAFGEEDKLAFLDVASP